MSKRVHEAIRGRVIRLPRRSDHRSCGRVDEEEVQAVCGRALVEQPCTSRFGRKNRRNAIRCLTFDRAVSQRERRVHDPFERARVRLDAAEDPIHSFRVADVLDQRFDFGSDQARMIDCVLRFRSRRPAADEDEFARALLGEPTRRERTEHAECARNEIGPVARDRRR